MAQKTDWKKKVRKTTRKEWIFPSFISKSKEKKGWENRKENKRKVKALFTPNPPLFSL